jgi:hypothetical protein
MGQHMNLLVAILEFFETTRYRSTSDMNFDERFGGKLEKTTRTAILRTLSMPEIGLIEKQPNCARRDAAYRLTERGVAVLRALKTFG